MFWNGGGWAWWQAGLMWFAVITLSALLILTVYALVTGITRKPDRAGQDAPGPGGARRILDERLARGEIEPEEYRRLREALDGSRDRPAGSGSGRWAAIPRIASRAGPLSAGSAVTAVASVASANSTP